MASLLAACGGGDDGDGGGDGDVAEIDACQLVTQADAAALFGQPATRDEGVEVVDPALLGECHWTYQAPDASSQNLSLYVWDNASGHYYLSEEDGEPFAIGEEGYIRIDDFAGVDVGWRQDDLAVYLVFFTIGPMVPAATTRVDDVKALATDVSAALSP